MEEWDRKFTITVEKAMASLKANVISADQFIRRVINATEQREIEIYEYLKSLKKAKKERKSA